MTEKINCAICDAQSHSIKMHLKEAHPEMTVAQYEEKYPGAKLLSDMAVKMLEEQAAKKAAAAASAKTMMTGTEEATKPGFNVGSLTSRSTVLKQAMNDVFGLGMAKAAMSAKGDPIPISVLSPHDQQEMVPAISNDYVYDIDELKDVILGVELNIPTYLWGHKGTGKSEMVEQICARTNRPTIRVQHTVNTEESHVVGQWTVRDGQTVFELGPLPIAMINGWVYVADEYDFALPSVLSVYQAVLEGKPLVIKEADAKNRIIKPAANFRFMASGNTNGSGDETGLYQGTVVQNSANYDRFGVVVHKKYMPKAAESQILQNRAKLMKEDADKMVEFAALVREAYDGAKISDTVSPRSLIFAARIGVKRGSFRKGLTLSFISKLSRVDREVADGLAQRIFG
jgi:cobaltochelatase CobS